MSCPFFDSLPENPTPEQMHNALIGAISESIELALISLKSDLKMILSRAEEFSSEDKLDNALEKALTNHLEYVKLRLETWFYGCPDVFDNVAEAISTPELLYTYEEDGDSTPQHAGVYYGRFWYGVTKTQPDPSVCVALNHIHAEAIEKVMQEVSCEFDDKQFSLNHKPAFYCSPSPQPRTTYAPPKKIGLSFWLLIIAAVGAVIAIAIYFNR